MCLCIICLCVLCCLVPWWFRVAFVLLNRWRTGVLGCPGGRRPWLKRSTGGDRWETQQPASHHGTANDVLTHIFVILHKHTLLLSDCCFQKEKLSPKSFQSNKAPLPEKLVFGWEITFQVSGYCPRGWNIFISKSPVCVGDNSRLCDREFFH